MKYPKLADMILFEDDDVIVVNKPPFISTLDEREGGEVNMLRLAKAYTPDAQICHRLDKETSGALIIAKNPEAHRAAAYDIAREYLAADKVIPPMIEAIFTKPRQRPTTPGSIPPGKV